MVAGRLQFERPGVLAGVLHLHSRVIRYCSNIDHARAPLKGHARCHRRWASDRSAGCRADARRPHKRSLRKVTLPLKSEASHLSQVVDLHGRLQRQCALVGHCHQLRVASRSNCASSKSIISLCFTTGIDKVLLPAHLAKRRLDPFRARRRNAEKIESSPSDHSSEHSRTR
jgi:hypothetical protein